MTFRSDMDWNPIETAPHDGTKVLLFGYGEIAVGEYNFDELSQIEFWVMVKKENGGCVAFFYPTHWMPLPEPPTTEMKNEN